MVHLTHTATLPPTGRRQLLLDSFKMHHFQIAPLCFFCAHLAVCVFLLPLSSVCFLYHPVLLFQEREAQMREPISSAAPPPAAVARPLAEPSWDSTTRSPVFLRQEFEKRTLAVSQTHACHLWCSDLSMSVCKMLISILSNLPVFCVCSQ